METDTDSVKTESQRRHFVEEIVDFCDKLQLRIVGVLEIAEVPSMAKHTNRRLCSNMKNGCEHSLAELKSLALSIVSKTSR